MGMDEFFPLDWDGSVRAAMQRRIDQAYTSGFYGGAQTANVPGPAATTLTIEKLRSAVDMLKRVRPPDDGLSEIIVTAQATKETGERLFPASRHRSRRIRKKLLRRFGGEFKRVPASWKVGTVLIVHPALAAPVIAAAKPVDLTRNPLFEIPVRWL